MRQFGLFVCARFIFRFFILLYVLKNYTYMCDMVFYSMSLWKKILILSTQFIYYLHPLQSCMHSFMYFSCVLTAVTKCWHFAFIYIARRCNERPNASCESLHGYRFIDLKRFSSVPLVFGMETHETTIRCISKQLKYGNNSKYKASIDVPAQFGACRPIHIFPLPPGGAPINEWMLEISWNFLCAFISIDIFLLF